MVDRRARGRPARAPDRGCVVSAAIRRCSGQPPHEPGVVRPRPGGRPGRGELAGPGVPGRRRDPAVHGLGHRPLPDRRGRQLLRGPRLLLGSDDPRACAPRRGVGRRRGGRPRVLLRHPRPGRGRAGRGDRAPGGTGRDGPAGVLGHGGDHVGDPPGPRVHRPSARREVRRLLPRPRRLAAGRSGLGHRDARPAGLPRRHRRAGRRDHRPALQRPARPRSPVRRARRRRSPR